MNYTKLASEARKLYHALRDEEFYEDQAYEIVKVCVRDYPIFQEMIEEEQTTEYSIDDIIGYLHFVDEHTEPIYKATKVCSNAVDVQTSKETYRVAKEDNPFSFSEDIKFFRYDPERTETGWIRDFSISEIEMKVSDLTC